MLIRRWPLWLQLTSAMLGVSVVVALAAGEMMRAIETDYLQDELRRESLRTSQAITIALTDTVASGRFTQLEALVTQMHRDDAFIHSLALLDDNGRTVSRWVGAATAAPAATEAMFYFSNDTEIPGQGHGRLMVSWNVAGLKSSIEEHVGELRLNMIRTVGVLGVLLVVLVHYLVMRPVDALGRGLDSLARGASGEPVRLSPLAAGELDRLARSVGELGRYQRELKETQQSLDGARRAAESAAEAKGRFLAVMSHEIRTPLNGVIGNLELMDDSKLDSQEKSLLRNAQRSVDSLLEIINEILDFSRIEAGGIQLEAVEYQLEAQINDVATSVAALVDPEKVELVVDFDPALPGRVRGDPLRLRQIITNLLGNAIKFTSEGCVVLSAMRIDEQRLRVEVSDTGIGISKEQQASLFSPFTQADSGTSRKFGGTGLGLSICRQLVELMDGQIGIDSWPGVGSTFWFEIPMIQLEPPRRFDEAGLRGQRALVVEPDRFVCKAVGSYLESIGLHVVTVEDLAQARSWLEGRGYPIRFILVDGRLASERERADLGHMKEHCGDPDPRVIAMLPQGRVLAEGVADAFVLKPVRRSDLLTAMLDEHGEDPAEDAATRDEVVRSEHRPRVLIVDDNPMNLQVARAMLERLNLEVHAANGGAEALSLMDSVGFQVILMDEQMPDMDGLEATRRIRARDGGDASTPVVALTANADKDSERRCLDAGMDGFIPKPVRRKALRVSLSRWLPSLLDAPARAPSA